MSKPWREQIRCFCSRKPLLAMYGKGEDGEPYIHILVYKQRRIYGDIHIDGDANCRIRCRECLRVHRIRIITRRRRLELEQEVIDGAADTDVPGKIAPAGRGA